MDYRGRIVIVLAAIALSPLPDAQALTFDRVELVPFDGESYLAAFYQRAPAQSVIYQVSPDLQTWKVAGSEPGVPGVVESTATPEEGMIDVTARLDLPISTANRYFLRLVLPSTRRTHVDFNGDGRSDWAVVRAAGNDVTWYVQYNSVTGGLTETFGSASTDFFTPADFDGDGKVDLAVWRIGTPGRFFILESSTGSEREVPLGQEGDDPRVVADYDGDGRADPAVFRQPFSPGAQGTFIYIGSANNPTAQTTTVPWGGPSFGFPYPGDFDGDGRADFCVQREKPGNTSVGQFALLLASGA